MKFTSSPLLITKVRFEIKAKRLDVSPPAEIQIEAKAQQVIICWQPENNPNITGYTITRWDETGQMKQYHLDNSEASRFVDTEVSPDTSYTYQVAVNTTAGIQLQSKQFAVKVQPLPGETKVLPCYPNPSDVGVYFRTN